MSRVLSGVDASQFGGVAVNGIEFKSLISPLQKLDFNTPVGMKLAGPVIGRLESHGVTPAAFNKLSSNEQASVLSKAVADSALDIGSAASALLQSGQSSSAELESLSALADVAGPSSKAVAAMGGRTETTEASIRRIANTLGAAQAEDVSQPGVLEGILRSDNAIVVAHGKNDYRDVAGESTWKNIAHSVETSGGRPIVIEADIRQVGEEFIVFHDATFHAKIRDYKTPQHKIDQFRQEYPELARQMEGRWDFFLFDGVESFGADELGKIKIYDSPSGNEYPLINLKELLKSIASPGKLRIPEHTYEARGPPASVGKVPSQEIASGPIAVYLDLKAINHLARRLYNLPDWHWIIGTWATERIEELTRKTLQTLSKALSGSQAHDKSFIAVRHPQVAAMARQIDPGIRIMASPDNVTPQTTADQWIAAMEAFLAHAPDLIEVKFLNHMLNPKIREWAREHSLKILYNQIPQTDTTQFEGVYQDELGLLISHLVEQGTDILIQTNTPGDVGSLVAKK